MKILSIDIGIKNFSFCLFEIILTTENTNTENYKYRKYKYRKYKYRKY